MADTTHNIDIEKIDVSIQMLEQYVQDPSIEPVKSILEELKQDSGNESLIKKLGDTVQNLGIIQGAVLTYAPYISILISNDLFEND